MVAEFWWFVTRASGIVAWLMLTASVIWGVLLSTKAFPETRRPAWLHDLHRWLGGLTMSFVAIHVSALVADDYTHFGLADIAVPFATSWKSGAVALGIVAGWLLVAVEVTSLAMKHVPRKAWRAIHLTSYITFWLTSLHGAFAGSDRTSWLYQATAGASIIAVAWAVLYRVSTRRPRQRGRNAPSPDGAHGRTRRSAPVATR